MCDVNDMIYEDEIEDLRRQQHKERQLRNLHLHNLDAAEVYDETDKPDTLRCNPRHSPEC